MLLRVLVNVSNHIPKLLISRDRKTSKGVLEQAACPSVGFVDGLCVGVEEIGELITNILRP